MDDSLNFEMILDILEMILYIDKMIKLNLP